jgi:uncharacterized membrane-anchored protein YhcB (DUF1043 family)
VGRGDVNVMTDDESKVRFDLWTVLGFLVLLVGICLGYLFLAQGADRVDQQKTQKDVAVLQERYENINQKLDKLIVTMEKTVDKLDAYKNEVRAKKTNVSDLKWK